MKKSTLLDRIFDFFWNDRIRAVRYFFAKQWLDGNFGEQEYWGDYISELIEFKKTSPKTMIKGK